MRKASKLVKMEVLEYGRYGNVKHYIVSHPHGVSAFTDKKAAQAFKQKCVREIVEEMTSQTKE